MRDPDLGNMQVRPTSSVVLALTLAAFFVLAFAQAMTQRPWCDEAWFFSPAVNLVTTGSTGTSNFEHAGTGFLRIDERTYWTFPLHMVAQALWYQVLPANLFTMRALSIFWGATLVVAWFAIVRQLSGSVRLAALAAALTSLDYIVVRSSAEGRMDVMCAALGYLGLATYLTLREKHFAAAIVVSQTLLAASALTHPNALLHITGVAVTVLYLDRRRLRIGHVVLAATPYIVAILAWVPYIWQDPEAFRAQLEANGRNRSQGWWNPLQAIADDFTQRYLPHVGGIGADLTPVHRVKVVILIGYALGVAGAWLTTRARRELRLVPLLTVVLFLVLAMFDAHKISLYLVHVTPLYGACVAIAVWNWWSVSPRVRFAVAAALTLFCAVQVAGTAYVVKRNSYRNDFVPVAQFLGEHWKRDSYLMGSAELTFALGLDPLIVDDRLLGAASGKRAGMIVVEQRYDKDHRAAAVLLPEAYRHVRKVLDRDHEIVYSRGPYRVYARRDGAPAENAP